MAEQENKVVKDTETEDKMQELFDLLDQKAATGELNEIDENDKAQNEQFQKEMEEAVGPMTDSERAAYEYSMMMKQYEAMLLDYQRREAEEKAAAKQEKNPDASCGNS